LRTAIGMELKSTASNHAEDCGCFAPISFPIAKAWKHGANSRESRDFAQHSASPYEDFLNSDSHNKSGPLCNLP